MSKIKYILPVFTMLLLFAACGDSSNGPEDIIPRDVLILGDWESVVHREDGNIVTNADFRRFEFRDDGTVLIEEFEEDGSPIDDIEDNWTLVESDEKIQFGTEGLYDIIEMADNSMTLEYNSLDPFSGEVVRHSDDFLKQ